MRHHKTQILNQVPTSGTKTVAVSRAANPLLAKVLAERRRHRPRSQEQPSELLQRIARRSRVIIIEGISGSGKDTLQRHLKSLLTHRDVYDFSEGEVLHSWKHLPIAGVAELRVKLMNRLANYIKDLVNRDENAVFLLNRFHLSTFASTVHQHPELVSEYNGIVNVLKTLPVHIIILQLDDDEIDKRSVHPERSGAWQKFQQQIVEKNGFRGRLERQQKSIIDTAKRQQMPYSILKVDYTPDIGGDQVRISEAPTDNRRGMRVTAGDAKVTRKNRKISPALNKA